MIPQRTLNPLKILDAKVKTCSACPLNDNKVIYRTNNILPIQLLLIGEAPGMVEYIQRKPFVGPAGHELDALLQECVPATMGYVIVNSLSCTPWEDKETKSKIRTPKTSEAKFCTTLNILPFIEQLKPKYIIALGKIANSALTKKVEHLHVIHPSAILQSIHQEYERQKFILAVREYLNASNV